MIIQIKQGDSFWYYSQLFGIPLPLIIASNRQLNPNQLMIGQEVNIPGYQSLSYTIKANDTLWAIAQANQISLDLLLRMNSSVQPTQLQVGQTIILPQRVTNPVISDVNNYTYEKMIADLQLLIDIYPFIQQQSIGNSVLEKNIIELQIGTGQRQKHINGAFHAQEWITTPVIMLFLNEYALALTNNLPIRNLDMLTYFENNTLSLVPMVNPDGVNLVINGAEAAGPQEDFVLSLNNGSSDFTGWKANINGVDLNNQYPALWETEAARKPDSPAPRDFPGYQPLSEPEAIAMADLANARSFEIVNAFHTQGEVIYWGYQGMEPPASETIVQEFNRVSGYEPIQYVDSFAGYKDWFIQEFRRPGYTVELGTGVNPLPINQFDEIYQETLGIMLATLYM
ncbi:gamma-D-glutamyl-{L}-meso-diaminopimelate peptidase I . Metallo peptidase. MEROPS family M14C [Gracilibacillus orientalis]|uniref:Gamma-D-glutamyl-(L)-meso-diaminopimelate peptidase I. Metallo peptidase. MEROPS family M14C n=1 Tax=Gracilibacillus orientalis TaxID=334253 RepID=A0A1I4IPR4_9BACI|nr:M14 family metallopeptidase [Gracilibacillus orientalis]SFL55821.1 gamma-D-glutamyl-{L}-meso-diaminopimelate peptidase I . Metallo peptidase. MEROPS family M14C [Gracilibacillus orientalis]